MDKSLDDRILDYLRTVSGSTAWAMRGYIGERDRPTISKALQRLKRKGLVRTNHVQASYWMAVSQAGNATLAAAQEVEDDAKP